jgi:2-dehydropantoate 2-reductase
MKPDRLLILGTGALATYFAARLSASGVAVTLLGTWAEGVEALNAHGAELDGQPFPVHATMNPLACRGAELALVLVKSWQTGRAAQQLAECLAADGLAVTLQNGLGNDVVLAQALGAKRVVRGITTLGATLVGPGRALSGGEGPVTVERNPRIEPFLSMLHKAGLEVHVVVDAEALIWNKLIVSSAINPLTALLRVPNGELLEMPSAKMLMEELARESAEVAGSTGILVQSSNPARLVEEVARRTARNISSMLQDVLRSAPTEVDAINGAIVRTGEMHDIPTPLNRALWKLVRELPKI